MVNIFNSVINIFKFKIRKKKIKRAVFILKANQKYSNIKVFDMLEYRA